MICYRRKRPRPPTDWKKLAWRRAQPYAVMGNADVSTIFGGAPYRDTKRVEGVPNGCSGRIRTQPLEPSVELPIGLRNV
eukprot:3773648-Pyramimonas_sp.AAC.1